jgi:biopolymer transport protein ExbB
MRGSSLRSGKYAKKVSGAFAGRALDAYGPEQRAGFREASGRQVRIERLVKNILSSQGVMVSLNHFYMNFGKRLDRLRRTYTGDTLADEVCIEYGRWETRGLSAAILDLIVAALGLPSCAAAPPTCDWIYKMKLTFSGNVSATDLDDFPVMVRLTSLNFDFTHAQALGQDIRFMDSDLCPSDGTPLKHEIEKWDQAGEDAVVWVKVPRIDGGSAVDFIYMYYGNAAVADGQDPPNVWDAGFEAVYHLLGNGTAAIPDSTINAKNVSKLAVGEPANSAAGIADGCQDFDGANDRITGTFPDLDTGDLTVGCWINTSNTGERMPWGYYTPTPKDDYHLDFYANNVDFGLKVNNVGCNIVHAATVNDGAWHYIVVMRDSDDLHLYIDGAWAASCSGVAGLDVTVPSVNMYIGCRNQPATGPAYFFDGLIDEFRIHGTARSPDWIMATYKAVSDTLISYGAEQPA